MFLVRFCPLLIICVGHIVGGAYSSSSLIMFLNVTLFPNRNEDGGEGLFGNEIVK